MSSYQAAQNRNEIDKTLIMISSPPQTVIGDDTNVNGYRLISDNTVRSIVPGLNTSMKINNNQILINSKVNISSTSQTLSIQATDKAIKIDTTLLDNLLSSYITKINDMTKGKKYVSIDRKDSTILLDTSLLSSTLASLTYKVNDLSPKIGFRMAFNKCNILNQWGLITLPSNSITNTDPGIFNITFPSSLCNNNYGVRVSMQSSDPGIIQYNNTTAKGVIILTYNLRNKLINFDGDMTVEIIG